MATKTIIEAKKTYTGYQLRNAKPGTLVMAADKHYFRRNSSWASVGANHNTLKKDQVFCVIYAPLGDSKAETKTTGISKYNIGEFITFSQLAELPVGSKTKNSSYSFTLLEGNKIQLELLSVKYKETETFSTSAFKDFKAKLEFIAPVASQFKPGDTITGQQFSEMPVGTVVSYMGSAIELLEDSMVQEVSKEGQKYKPYSLNNIKVLNFTVESVPGTEPKPALPKVGDKIVLSRLLELPVGSYAKFENTYWRYFVVNVNGHKKISEINTTDIPRKPTTVTHTNGISVRVLYVAEEK